jgi:hypothetical protein
VVTATFSTASLTTPVPAGVYTVTATYNGDSNFVPGSNDSLTETVNQDSSTTAIRGSTSSVYGQLVGWTATVTSSVAGTIPTGTVTFYANGVALATVQVTRNATTKISSATYTTRGLAPNSYTIQAVYNGNNNVATSSSGTINLNVNQDKPLVGFIASTTTSNTTVTFTASVVATAPGSGTPTGTVTFTIDGQFEATVGLTNGKCSLTIPGGLPTGDHTIEVLYNGDTDFAMNEKIATIDFVKGRGT